jgi:hypothetical protein
MTYVEYAVTRSVRLATPELIGDTAYAVINGRETGWHLAASNFIQSTGRMRVLL